MSKTWSIYILRCRDNSLYTGITVDVSRRILEHQEQSKRSAKYLRGRLPFALVYSAAIGTHEAALKIEQEIKRWPKAKKEAWIVEHAIS